MEPQYRLVECPRRSSRQVPPGTRSLGAPETPEYPPGRVGARRAGDAAAGMRARATEIKPAYRRAVVGVAEHRPRREELVERERAVEDVPADQAEVALEVERREDFAGEYASLEVRRVTVHRVHHRVGCSVFHVVPALPVRQDRIEVLAEEARDVLSGRRETRIDGARDQG